MDCASLTIYDRFTTYRRRWRSYESSAPFNQKTGERSRRVTSILRKHPGLFAHITHTVAVRVSSRGYNHKGILAFSYSALTLLSLYNQRKMYGVVESSRKQRIFFWSVQRMGSRRKRVRGWVIRSDTNLTIQRCNSLRLTCISLYSVISHLAKKI